MSTITILGCTYQTKEFIEETVDLAALLAKNARLEFPLPVDTDLTEAEHKEIITQIPAMLTLPPFVLDTFWSAFAAHHLYALAAALRALSPSTQPKALYTLLQILSLLPDPTSEPYFRKFLCDSPESNGLPTLIATAFLHGIDHDGPSGPWHLCTLIIYLLLWCDPKQSDDGKASIDGDVRTALSRELLLVMQSPRISQLQLFQRHELERLYGLLDAIEHTQGAMYLASMRHFLGHYHITCVGRFCCEDGLVTCSRCKTVRYCGKACQTWHWKEGHMLRCFRTRH